MMRIIIRQTELREGKLQRMWTCVLVSRHLVNRDAGCQIRGKEAANWFVIKD